eukprot:GHVR01012541.1.p1 GENE.GHVR01012541.1~~GHVR01012541.1.p1  ORF type:complete len:1050 (+),score=256.13 GHVR01012541.1:34-3150(+)
MRLNPSLITTSHVFCGIVIIVDIILLTVFVSKYGSLRSVKHQYERSKDQYKHIIEKEFYKNEVVSYLKDMKDQKSIPRLMKAAAQGEMDVLSLLIHRGYNLDDVDGDGNTALMAASRDCKLDPLTSLIKHGADVHIKNSAGRTALHLAIGSHCTSAVNSLLQAQSDIHAVDYYSITPLGLACSHGETQSLPLLLQYMADIWETDAIGNTPLHTASISGHTDVVRMLLDQGADVNMPNHENDTPLHYGCRGGSVDVVRLLLENDADYHALDKSGNSALRLGMLSGSAYVVRALILKGAHLSYEFNDDDVTPLEWALLVCELPLANYLVRTREDVHCDTTEVANTAYNEGHIRFLEKLSREGHDVNCIDENKNSILYRASRDGHVSLVKEIYKNKHFKEDGGTSGLMGACEGGHIDIVNFLLDNKVDVNLKDKNKQTAIHFASMNGNVEIVQKLIKYGASINISTLVEQETPLMRAAALGKTDVVRALLEHKATIDLKDAGGNSAVSIGFIGGHRGVVTALHKHMLQNNIKFIFPYILTETYEGIARDLIDSGADVNSGVNGAPMTVAAYLGQYEFLKFLIEKHADIKPISKDIINAACVSGNVEVITYALSHGGEISQNAVHYAAQGGHVNAIKFLQKVALTQLFNLSLSTPDKEGNTPLMLAAKQGHLDVCVYLLDTVPDCIDAVNIEGETALYMACSNGHSEVGVMLLDRWARAGITTKEGSTPLLAAAEGGYSDLIEILIQRGSPAHTTPLIVASSLGSYDAVKLLLDSFAYPNSLDINNESALMAASRCGADDVVSLLINRGADLFHSNGGATALHYAVDNDHVRVVRVLLQGGMPPETSQRKLIDTPFAMALRTGKVEIVKEFIKFNVNINLFKNDYTPVYLASSVGRHEVVQVLLENHAYVDATDEEGRTALMIAAQRGFPRLAKLLIKYGADLGAKDFTLSGTLLYHAVIGGNIQIITTFLKMQTGVVNICTNLGETPLTAAVRLCNASAAKALVQAGADVEYKNNEGMSVLDIAKKNCPDDDDIVQSLNVK